MPPVHRYASSIHAGFGLKPETAPGTFEPGAYPLQRTKGVGLTTNETITQDSDVAMAGEPISAEVEARSFSASTPVDLCFNDCRTLLGPTLREDFPAEVAVVGTSDIDVLTNGAHQDSAIGPQLRAPTGAFDTLRTYAGAADNGAHALLADLSGASEANNNFPRGIKAVWDNGTNAFLDIHQGFVGGSAGLFGSPMVATAAPESIVIRVGTGIRNRLNAPNQYYSGLLHYSDMVNHARYQAMIGLTPNGATFSWSGKGNVGLEIPWEGVHLPALQTLDPTLGAGLDNSGLLYTPMVKGGKHLKYLVIVTDTGPIILTSLSVTSFNFQIPGGVSGIDDVAGTADRTGTMLGAHVPSGSIGVHLVDDPRSVQLAELGAPGTEQKARIVFMFEDSRRNMIWCQSLWNTFGQLAFTPTSGGGTVDGTLNFSGQQASSTSRSFTYQELAVAA